MRLCVTARLRPDKDGARADRAGEREKPCRATDTGVGAAEAEIEGGGDDAERDYCGVSISPFNDFEKFALRGGTAPTEAGRAGGGWVVC